MARRAPLRGIPQAVAGTLIGSLLAVIACTGLLYLAQPAFAVLDDAFVADALPLDELPGHASVSLLLFVLVWATLGVWLAAWTAHKRISQLALFAGTLWLWQNLTTAASLSVVRQETILSGERAALAVAAVYAAPAIAFTAAASTRLIRAREYRAARMPRRKLKDDHRFGVLG